MNFQIVVLNVQVSKTSDKDTKTVLSMTISMLAEVIFLERLKLKRILIIYHLAQLVVLIQLWIGHQEAVFTD